MISKRVIRTLLVTAIASGMAVFATGCVSVDSAPEVEPVAQEDPFIKACDAFRGYTEQFLSDEINFDLRAAKAQVAADEFSLLVSEHPEVASYVNELNSIVKNQGKYGDDLNVYSDLLDFCKKHPAE